MFNVYYKYSACIKICTDDISIICDPWFGNDAYYGTWTQFPDIEDPISLIGKNDYIYISHIHPDHYCNQTIKALLKTYENQKILIADWGEKPNHLARKIKSDGLGDKLKITNRIEINSTVINIIPNDTQSNSDIDSAIIVSSKKSNKAILNINDCIYNRNHFSKIKEIQKKEKLDFKLFCLGYTGAGPYPQTYYSPKIESEILIKKAQEKKLKFFKRYKKAITEIDSSYRLPFAGKYMLSKELSLLNKYRGVADAIEVKNFDPKAIILDDGGNSFFDLENERVSNERQKEYIYPDYIDNKINFYWREFVQENPNKLILKRLCISSIKRAHLKSECNENCFWSIYIFENSNYLDELWEHKNPELVYEPLLTFNCNKNKNPLYINIKPKIHSHLFIESKALFCVLTGITHWNNYEVGSVFQVRRIPDIHNADMQHYLNFLSVI
tara:strand:+ start:1878 stop:3200 length:1323 start_codon:yes stop_codon:yes gene_type:complete